MTGGHHPVAEQLPPGTYVLENAPLQAHSAKARHVAAMVAAGMAGASGVSEAEEALAAVLRDHRPVPGAGRPRAARPSCPRPACTPPLTGPGQP